MTTTTPDTAASPKTLARLLREGGSAKEIERYLDALSPAARVAEVLGITGKQVQRLYDAVADAPALTLDEIVPPTAKEGETIIFEGRNSLPMFSRFQKRFTRIGDALVGINQQTMSFLTGPGYFIVKPATGEAPNPTEPFFDYTVAPSKEPEGWPPYRSNDRGFSRNVYMDMHDYMRRVCKGVMVGKAYKRGVEQGAYFSLSRV